MSKWRLTKRGLYWPLLSTALVLLSSCDSGDNKEDPQEPYIAQSTPIFCEVISDSNPLQGCWEVEKCYYDPADFIFDPNDPSTNGEEDYWSRVIYSYSVDVQPFTVQGIQEYTEGRWTLNILYFKDPSCNGDPAFFSRGVLDTYYKRMEETFTATQDQIANVYMIVLGLYVGDSLENGRKYRSYYLDNPNRLCLGDPSSDRINIGGEIEVLETIRMDVCLTKIDTLNQSWMTSEQPPWRWALK